MPLLNDECRCHDDGCPQHENCLRWIERNAGGSHVEHAQSLFPYDVPLGGECNSMIPKEAEK